MEGIDAKLIVNLVVYGALFLFVLLGFLFGLWKGLKKASLRIVVFIALLVVSALVSQMVTTAVLNINITVDGTSQSIFDFISNLILQNESISNLYNSSEAFQQVFVAIPVALTNFVVFELLVYILGFLGWIIYLVLAAIFLRDKTKPYVIKDGKAVIATDIKKPKKRRLWGGLIGAVQGFVLLFVTFMPLTAICSTFMDLSMSTQDNVAYAEVLSESEYTPTSQYIQEVVPDEYLAIFQTYNQTLLSKISSIGGFDKVCFDTLSTVTIDGEKIVLRQEITNIAKVYDNVQTILTFDMNTQKFADIEFDKLESALDLLFDSGILKSILPDAIDFVLKDITTDNTLNINIDPDYIRFFSVAYDQYKQNKGMDAIKTDVYSVFNVVKALSTSGIMDEIVDGTVEVDNVFKLANKNNRNAVNTVISSVFSSDTVKALLSEAINFGLETVNAKNPTYNLPLIDKSKIDWTLVNSNFSTVVNAVMDIYQNYSENVQEPFSKITQSPQLLLNMDIDLLTTKLNTIMSKIQNSALLVSSTSETVYSRAIDIFEETEYSKFADLTVFKNQNAWNEELSYLNTALKSLKNSGITTAFGSTIDYELIFDKLATKDPNTNRTYVRDFVSPLLESKAFKRMVTDAGFGYVDSLLEKYQTEIGEDVVLGKVQTSKLSQENEKELVVSFFENLAIYVQDLSLDELKSDAFATIVASDLSRLGNALDTIKASQLFGPYEEDLTQNDGIYVNLINGLANNDDFNNFADFEVAKESDFSWNQELSLIQDAIDVLNSINITVDGKEKSILTAIKDGDDLTAIFEKLSTNNDDIDNIVNPLCQSKLMKKNIVVIVNTLNSKISQILDESIAEISAASELAEQKQDIIDVLKAVVDLYANIKDGVDDDTIKANSQQIGELLNLMLASKQNNGVFSGTYDAFISYVTNPQKSDYAARITYLLGEYQANNQTPDWVQILDVATAADGYDGGQINDTLKQKLAQLVGVVYNDQDCADITNSLIDCANIVVQLDSDTSSDDAIDCMIQVFETLEQYDTKMQKVDKVIDFIYNMTSSDDLNKLKDIDSFASQKQSLQEIKALTQTQNPTIDDVQSLIDKLAEDEFLLTTLDENQINIDVNSSLQTQVNDYIQQNITDNDIANKIKAVLNFA